MPNTKRDREIHRKRGRKSTSKTDKGKRLLFAGLEPVAVPLLGK